MATAPMLQSVLLFQHHQTTTPNLPHNGPGGGLGQAQGTLGRPIPAEEAPAPEKVEVQDGKPQQA